jgi:hypothetical protein
MCLSLFNSPLPTSAIDPNGGAGTTTSGGTESILMACKAYRDRASRERGITRPEMYALCHRDDFPSGILTPRPCCEGSCPCRLTPRSTRRQITSRSRFITFPSIPPRARLTSNSSSAPSTPTPSCSSAVQCVTMRLASGETRSPADVLILPPSQPNFPDGAIDGAGLAKDVKFSL